MTAVAIAGVGQRAMMEARTGPASQNRVGHADFRAHLLGKIAWVAESHPARGEWLREIFERIAWDAGAER